MLEREPLHRRIIAAFINSDYPALGVSAAIAIGMVLLTPGYVKQKYLTSFEGIPSTALALMGFVLAAAAIVVSVQDKGMIRLYKQHRPDLWRMTKRVFFLTARILGLLSIAVFILGDGPLIGCQYGSSWQVAQERIFLCTVVFALIFSIFQLNKMIYVLSKLMDAAQDTKLADEIEQGLKEQNDEGA